VIKVFPYQEIINLLERLEAGGWKVELEGENLTVRGNILPKPLMEEIKSKKELIIQFLSGDIKEEKIETHNEPDPNVLLSEPKTCYSCGGHSFWISKHDAHLRCVTCHPPATEEIVTGYINF